MRSPPLPQAASNSPSNPPPPRDALRGFLHQWATPHAMLALNGHLTLQEALDDIALLATARDKFGVLVGPAEVRLPNFEVVAEDGLGRRPADFLTELSEALIRRARVRSSPLLVFAPSDAYVAPWLELDTKLDTLRSAAPVRLCLPSREGLAQLPPETLAALQERHGASLAL